LEKRGEPRVEENLEKRREPREEKNT